MIKMRNIERLIIVLCCLSMVVMGSSCQANNVEEPQAATNEQRATQNTSSTSPASGGEAQPTSGELVYLRVEDAVASSFDDTPDWAPRPDSMAPVDGDLNTRWSSILGPDFDKEWIYFDFGKEKTVSKIIIRWEDAYATKYEIFTSSNAKGWQSFIFKDAGIGGVETIDVSPVRCRYVKIVGLERFNPEWGFSMWEVEMFGPKEANPDDKPIEEAFVVSEEEKETARALEKLKVGPGEIAPSPGPIEEGEFHRGVNYTSWDRDELSGEMSDSSLIYLSKLGVGHISLMAVWYQESVDSEEIYPDEKKTVSDESLSHAINVIHKLGMKVMLKPHIDLVDGDFRADILPTDKWFESYKKFILHYADVAAKYSVEILCIGTELSNTTTTKWQDKWFDIIDEVRRAYNGTIVYAANWDEYDTVPLWDKLDYIGIDAYFPLTNKDDPTKEELRQVWMGYADTIENWLKTKGLMEMGVIFTEIGYDSVDGCNIQPWSIRPTLATLVEDQQEQADCLEALSTALSKRRWFKGIYWWNYFPRKDIGVLGYTLRGKKGEKLLAEWYKEKL